MKKKLCIFFLILFSSLNVNSQEIDFIIEGLKNKTYSFVVFNGQKMDTIAKGITSAEATGKIIIPQKYQSISAMGVFSVEGKKPLPLIVNKDNFKFVVTQDNNLQFQNSLENTLFHLKRNEAASEENKETFVYSYSKMLNAVMQMNKVLSQRDSFDLFKKGSARLAALNAADIDVLYYSNLWTYLIDGLMRLSIGEEGFAKDMIRLLDKTKGDAVYLAFVEDLITITNQFGMDDTFDIIIPHVVESKRIKYPQGIVYDAFAMAKVRKGTRAPELKNVSKPSIEDKYQLIIFHQPECESCHEQLNLLIEKYNFFKENRVRVISISGALNKEDYEQESGPFLWEDKFCDYKGFAGENYLSYGVVGTPTIYLIDDENIVLGRFALVSDVESYLKGSR